MPQVTHITCDSIAYSVVRCVTASAGRRPQARARRCAASAARLMCAPPWRSSCAASASLDDLLARDRDDLQPAVENEGLGQRDRAVGARRTTHRGRADSGSVSPCAGDVAQRVRADVLVVDADHGARAARGERPLRLLDQRRLRGARVSTTRPRSSRPRPSRASARATRPARPTPSSTGSSRVASGAAGVAVRGERLVERAARALLREAEDQQRRRRPRRRRPMIAGTSLRRTLQTLDRYDCSAEPAGLVHR